MHTAKTYFQLALVPLAVGPLTCLTGCGVPGEGLDPGTGPSPSALRQASLSTRFSILGYAVQSHSSCGLPNLSHTIDEMHGFRDDSPSDFGIAASFVNQDVWASDWKHGTDYYSSGTASGLDGADSATVAYISTHGSTSGGVYRFTSGSPSHGSCRGASTGMKLGVHNARYLFLSTCESVKIGSGINPYAAGENPYRTWSDAVDGVRCIFGYSSNSVDDTDYGSGFWSELGSGSNLAEAFLDTSWNISRSQVPAVICFGGSDVEAGNNLAATSFTESRTSSHNAQWRWYNATSLVVERTPTLITARSLTVRPGSQLNAAVLPTLRRELTSLGKEDLDTPAADVTYSDQAAAAAARQFLTARHLSSGQDGLSAAYVRSEGRASSAGQRWTPRKTVSFAQQVAGAPVLSARHEVRVALDSQLRVRAIYDGTMTLTAQSGEAPFLDDEAARERARQALQAQLRQQLGLGSTADVAVAELTVGFDLDHADAAGRVPLEYHALLQVRGAHSKLHKLSVPAQ